MGCDSAELCGGQLGSATLELLGERFNFGVELAVLLRQLCTSLVVVFYSRGVGFAAGSQTLDAADGFTGDFFHGLFRLDAENAADFGEKLGGVDRFGDIVTAANFIANFHALSFGF